MESKDFHPIQDIRQEALELSGLTYERAFALDEIDISGQVNEYFVARLLEFFYNRVYADKDESFRSMFTSPKETNSQNLMDYIVQRVGSKPYYSERKGFPALIHRHMYFDINNKSAIRWLDHMEEALDDMQDEISEANKGILLDHLRYTAYYLVAAQNLQRKMGNMGSLYV